MAEVTEVVKVSSGKGRGMTIFWAVLITLVVLGVVMLLMKLHRKMFSVNQSTIANNITTLLNSPPFPLPNGMTLVTATSILNNQVQAMLKNQGAMKAAANYAQLTAVPLEQVVVNEAYYQCHAYTWL